MIETLARTAVMTEVVQTLDAATARLVREFLAGGGAGGASVEHDPRWLGVLSGALGHRTMAVLARDEAGDLGGYLPLALVSSRLFGRFLVSLPYVNRAGVVAADAATRRALVEKAVELAAEHRADYLELRHSEPVAHDFLPVSRDEKVRMVLELPAEMDGLWAGYNAKVRNQVRKGDKFNLSIRWGGSELIRPFYDVFAVNMRDLGTPVYPRKLFERIVAAFDGSDTDGDRVDGTTSPLGALAEIAVVEHEGKPIGGALLLHDPRIERLTVVPSASVLRQFNHTNANMWMYHRLLMRAVQRGSRWFDFGRSSEDSGTYRFKKQWGAQPRPTVWQYHVRRGDRAVIGAVRPDNPKYQRRIEAWKRLPVWLTRLIGPRIVRGIP